MSRPPLLCQEGSGTPIHLHQPGLQIKFDLCGFVGDHCDRFMENSLAFGIANFDVVIARPKLKLLQIPRLACKAAIDIHQILLLVSIDLDVAGNSSWNDVCRCPGRSVPGWTIKTEAV